MIECGTHGLKGRGYIACVHVLAGEHVAHYQEAGDRPGVEGLGEVLCKRCAERLPEPVLDDLRLVCGECLRRVLVARA